MRREWKWKWEREWEWEWKWECTIKKKKIKEELKEIKSLTISERDTKKCWNTFNKIKNAEIKYKRFIPKQKELLNLFNDLLDTILTDKTLMSSK